MTSTILRSLSLATALSILPISAATAAGQQTNGAAQHKAYTLDTPVGTLLDNAQARAVIAQYAPVVLKASDNPMGRTMSLRQMQPFSSQLNDKTLAKIAAALAKLNKQPHG